MNPGDLEIRTRGGWLAGTRVSLPAGPGVRAWRGVPYAAPPMGPLRWRPPAAVSPWSGVRPAHLFGPDCPQQPLPASCAPNQSEDCLYLNVWAPAPTHVAMPVMVWLHGGGFVGGSGADARCEGSRLAQLGVVVVTANYRVGLFGYLAHPELSRESEAGVSGNYGLLDQLAALRWVRDNIEAFGGDPQRVTVFGVSAGSASISLLLTSPLAADLFQQAILHSPGAGRPLASLTEAEAAGWGLHPDIRTLRERPAVDILALTHRLSPKVRGLTTARVLRPILDGHVVPEDEREALQAGRFHAMPMIVGTNADEGSLLTAGWPVDSVQAYERMMADNFGPHAAQALAVYPVCDDEQAHARIGEVFADTQFNRGARLLARAMCRREPRTWRYVFTRRRPGQRDGPHHGEEVGHVFGNLAASRGRDPAPFDAVDQAVSREMMRRWTAFAQHGEPNSGPPVWPAYRPATDEHLEFGDRPCVGRAWREHSLDFLDAFYDAG